MTSTQHVRPDARPFVLACVDGTDDGDRAIRFAVEEAHRRGCGLHLVHVQMPPVVAPPMVPIVSPSTLHEVAAGILKSAEQRAREHGWTEPDLEVVHSVGPRRDAILRAAQGAGCIVLGRRSSSLDHLLTGSTTASVAAHADVPVASVSEAWEPAAAHGLVVVGIDGPEVLAELARAGFEEARRRSARVEVLHAWRPAGIYDAAIGTHAVASTWRTRSRDDLTQWVHDLGHEVTRGVEWVITAEYDRPTTALAEASTRADLLVLGRHSHGTRLQRALGSTAHTLLRAAWSPVMIVPVPRHD